MRLGFDCIHDVHHLYAPCFKVIGNQRPMTTPPDRFRAHDRSWTGVGSAIEKMLNTIVERFGLHVVGITAK